MGDGVAGPLARNGQLLQKWTWDESQEVVLMSGWGIWAEN